ncbi:MAG: dephospho-CoA kinase [Candidatus Dasytiphilus stammeri]
MPYKVALTGGIGSGKTTVSKEFAKLGVEVVDADVISRQVVEPGKLALIAIIKKFGKRILNLDGTLNRVKLRQIIIHSPKDKIWLNNLLHPLIDHETNLQLVNCKSVWCLWVVPLLVENKLYTLAQRVLVVDVDREKQLIRTMLRDQVSRQQAEQIISMQATREERLAIADDIIDNNGSKKMWISKIKRLYQSYLSLALAEKNEKNLKS